MVEYSFKFTMPITHVLGLSRETEPVVRTCAHTHTHEIYRELAYVVKETEKSHTLPRKARVGFQSESNIWELEESVV